jgi:hypothetical protein
MGVVQSDLQPLPTGGLREAGAHEAVRGAEYLLVRRQHVHVPRGRDEQVHRRRPRGVAVQVERESKGLETRFSLHRFKG